MTQQIRDSQNFLWYFLIKEANQSLLWDTNHKGRQQKGPSSQYGGLYTSLLLATTGVMLLLHEASGTWLCHKQKTQVISRATPNSAVWHNQNRPGDSLVVTPLMRRGQCIPSDDLSNDGGRGGSTPAPVCDLSPQVATVGCDYLEC